MFMKKGDGKGWGGGWGVMKGRYEGHEWDVGRNTRSGRRLRYATRVEGALGERGRRRRGHRRHWAWTPRRPAHHTTPRLAATPQRPLMHALSCPVPPRPALH